MRKIAPVVLLLAVLLVVTWRWLVPGARAEPASATPFAVFVPLALAMPASPTVRPTGTPLPTPFLLPTETPYPKTPLTVLSWEYHLNPDGPDDPIVKEWGYLAIRLRNESDRPLLTAGWLRCQVHYEGGEPFEIVLPHGEEAQCRFPAPPVGCDPVRIEPFGEVDVEWYTWNLVKVIEITAFGIPPHDG